MRRRGHLDQDPVAVLRASADLRRSGGVRHLAAVAIVALCGCAPGRDEVAPVPVAAADSVVRAWVDAERIPGAVLLVDQAGSIIHQQAYGSAWMYDYGGGQYPGAEGGIERRASPVAMTTGTVFDMASVTKVMATTMAVMLLVDRGTLDVEAPVSRWLPEFTGDGRDQITLRHLLTHRSGLPQWVPVYYHAMDADAAYAYIRSLPLMWPVGAERHYSDLGFMLLGRVVEQTTGQTLDHFLEAQLYGPLGLRHTGFRRVGPDPALSDEVFAATSHGNPYEYRMVHDLDFGYRIEGDADSWDGWRHRTLYGEVNDGNSYHAFQGVAGHAGLFSTAQDLDVLLRLLLGEGQVDGVRVIAAHTVRSFLESTGDAQALGWQLPTYAPAGSFGHTGFTGTFVLGVPSRDLAVVLLTNRQNVGVDADTSYPDVGPLQRAVTEALTGAPPR